LRSGKIGLALFEQVLRIDRLRLDGGASREGKGGDDGEGDFFAWQLGHDFFTGSVEADVFGFHGTRIEVPHDPAERSCYKSNEILNSTSNSREEHALRYPGASSARGKYNGYPA